MTDGSALALARRIRARLPLRVRGSGLLRARADRLSATEAEREIRELIHTVRPYTMVAEPPLLDLVGRVHGVLDASVPGAMVECGVWRGGASFLMAKVVKRRGETDRKVWLFDSFEGLPTPKLIDGPGAAAYAENEDSPLYLDNCRANLEEVRAAARDLGVAELTEVIPGWFDTTLAATSDRIGPIALLRIDCDWYDPVMLCLETLYDQVSPGGVLVIDDYYVWDGCAIAVHEFLTRHRLPLRVQEAAGVAVLWKPT